MHHEIAGNVAFHDSYRHRRFLAEGLPLQVLRLKHLKLQNDAGFNWWPGVSVCMGQGDAKGEVKHGNLIG